jgi:hypothetical protein
MATQIQKFEALFEQYNPEMAKAFRESIAAVGENADLKGMREALAAGDVEAALRALDLDTADFYRLEEKFREVFITAGVETADGIPVQTDPFGGIVRVRFTPRHVVAESFLAQHSSTLVRDITVDTRNAVRSTMVKALSEGKNPTTIVTEVVGRVNRATGRREGGVLGLTSEQAIWVGNAQDELTSGDLNGYLSRKQRNVKYDGPIKRAIESGQPVPPATMRAALDSYRNRLLALRAKTIGRTETMTALNVGRHTAIEQAIAEGKIMPDNVTKKWRDAHDRKVRHDHAVLGSRPAIPYNEAHVSPNGDRMRFPMDRSLGARSQSIIGCRCQEEYRFDFFAGVT